MTKEEYLKAANMVIYLSGCAVNGIVPEKEKLEGIDLVQLYTAAKNHFLAAVVCHTLEAAGIHDHSFHQAKAKSIRKTAAMEIDKELLFERFEHEGIWYMPLKGMVIKDLYPSIGLRQMSDFDILFDGTYAKKVKDIMLELGFSCEHFGKHHHDVYFKQPVSNFEMHTGLFSEMYEKEIYEYYRDIKKRLIKEESCSYGYRFSNEDMYIYITAHEYKHFSGGGTGLRSLLDIYVINQKLGSSLDYSYIKQECQKLGIDDFEQQNRQLASKLFSGQKLDRQENEMLEFIIFSGTYGTVKNHIENSVKKYGCGKKGKRKYIISKLFMPMSTIKVTYPTVYKHKILVPALFFYRMGKAITVKRKDTVKKIKILRKIK